MNIPCQFYQNCEGVSVISDSVLAFYPARLRPRKVFRTFMKYHGNNICPGKRLNERTKNGWTNERDNGTARKQCLR